MQYRHTYIYTVYIHYIYIYTHTHTHIYIYICVCVWVGVCVCVCNIWTDVILKLPLFSCRGTQHFTGTVSNEATSEMGFPAWPAGRTCITPSRRSTLYHSSCLIARFGFSSRRITTMMQSLQWCSSCLVRVWVCVCVCLFVCTFRICLHNVVPPVASLIPPGDYKVGDP